MRYLSIFLFVLFSNIGIYNAVGAGYRDKELGILFPEKIEGLTFRKCVPSPIKKLGVSLHYESEDTEDIYAEICIFDRTYSDIKTGHSGERVKDESEVGWLTRTSAEIRKEYRRFPPPPIVVPKNKNGIRFLKVTLEYNRFPPKHSDYLVTGFYGKFIKIIITYNLQKRKKYEKMSKAFVSKLSKILTFIDKQRTKEALVILSYIKTFEKAPFSPEGKRAIAKLLKFANDSSRIEVVVSKKYLPGVEKSVKNSNLLLFAYIAGNIQEQLNKKMCRNSPMQGVCKLIKMYDYLREHNKIKRIEQIEKWSVLNLKGELQIK